MNNRIFKVNDDTSSTIYCQLAEFIADSIHAEEIKVGGRLLSVNDACREYNVSKEWLLTGEGEMFKPVASDEVDALVQKYNLDDKARAIIEKFIVLKPSEQETILDFVASVSKEMLKSEEKKK